MKRARQVGRAGVDQALLDLINKFDYPLGQAGGSVTLNEGEGGAAPTLVVAAADATDTSKSRSDFICTGVADDIIIQTALSQIATNRGRVLLTEGNYGFENPITIAGGAMLQGMGFDATFIGGALGLDYLISTDRTVLSDLFIANTASSGSGDGAIRATGSSVIQRVIARAPATGHAFANETDDPVWVDHCVFDGAGIGVFSDQNNAKLMVTHNYMEGCLNGVNLTQTGDYWIAGNYILEPTQHGIVIDCNGGRFQGNMVNGAGSASSDTYDSYHITGDRNSVLGNYSIPWTATTRYGINVVAGATNNAVFANYLDDSSNYATADSVDAGTGTITSAAGGAIGGQFAY